MQPNAWMVLSLSLSWLVCWSYVCSGHTCWWACQRKEKTNPLKLNCRVMLLCCPLDPRVAKPTCLVRILDNIKMLLAYLIHFLCSAGYIHVFFFYLFFLFMSALFALSGQTVMQNLPSAVQTLCETWNNIHTNEFPNIGSWVCMLFLQLLE